MTNINIFKTYKSVDGKIEKYKRIWCYLLYNNIINFNILVLKNKHTYNHL